MRLCHIPLESRRGIFQSTHPSRGATIQLGLAEMYDSISIHAPLTGCDWSRWTKSPLLISFQSTHPSRGATSLYIGGSVAIIISIHAPLTDKILQISIHAPLTGCDYSRVCWWSRQWTFQSTHPSRGATGQFADSAAESVISIHAPLTGCDCQEQQT